MKVTEQIFALIHEYRDMEDMIDLKGSGSQELDLKPLFYPRLITIRRGLSCLSVDLATEVGKYQREAKNSKAQFEYTRYIKQKELMDEGTKVTAAEAQAKQYVAEMILQVATDEGLYSSGKLILTQVNEVLKSLNQDISIIKKEYENLTNIE